MSADEPFEWPDDEQLARMLMGWKIRDKGDQLRSEGRMFLTIPGDEVAQAFDDASGFLATTVRILSPGELATAVVGRAGDIPDARLAHHRRRGSPETGRERPGPSLRRRLPPN
jgi:hypothetical protein